MPRYYESQANRPVLRGDAAAEEAFRRLAADVGEAEPLATIEQLRPFQQQLWDRLEDLRSATPQARRAFHGTYVGVVSSPLFNAFADISTIYDAIGITTGFFTNVLLFFNIAISHRGAFSDWGDHSQEGEPFSDLSTIAWGEDVIGVLAQLDACGIAPCTPKNVTRIELANLLPRIAFDFVLYHEAAHIAFGHLEYLRRYTDTNRLLECGTRRSTPSLISQTLELQADIFAVWALTNPYCRRNIGSSEHPLVQNELIVTKILLTVASLFSIMDQHRTAVSHYDGCDHPHPGLRMTACLYFLLSNAESQSGLPCHSQVERIWNNAMKPLAELARLGFHTSVTEVINEREMFADRLMSLFRELARISPELMARDVGMQFTMSAK